MEARDILPLLKHESSAGGISFILGINLFLSQCYFINYVSLFYEQTD